MPVWDPEHVVTPEEARRLIDDACPDLAPCRVEPYASGWDNTVHLVNGDLVFRFPRRTIAAPLVERELRILPELAPLPLDIPLPRWSGGPTAGYPWRFMGYRRLPGRTATAAGLDDQARAACAAPLAAFLRALHAFPVERAAALGAPGDDIGRLDVALRLPRVREALAAVGRAGDPAAEAIMAAAEATAGAPRATVLAHGDLYASQLLVDDAGRPCGVIDWGDLHLGDPAVDLAGPLGFLPPPAFERFLAAYGPVSEVTMRLARLRALNHALNLVRYARDVGEGALHREALVALAHALG